ncbi:hypothetical protein BDR06DRAFT_956528 [Suillus hirtellus]|nr:hypothetical protein BDR06DRAFT_956528 [Suillus hirtellus]
MLVHQSTASARTAHQYLQNSATKDMDADGFVTGNPFQLPYDRHKSELPRAWLKVKG